MKVTSVETTIVEIPFDDGGRGVGITPTTWNTLEILLVRVTDDEGNEGWGEGFGYFTVDATKALVDRLIAPVLQGEVVEDIGAWNLVMQRRLHLFGRYGVTMFALSGVDMALWDLAAKRAGVPLFRLLAPGANARRVPFYASLVRYADADLIARTSVMALEAGFTGLKLHELTLPDIAACRAAVGADVPLAVDVNCNWSLSQAAALTPALKELGVSWLEEPVFPPEDYSSLASLRGAGLKLAAGENWCTAEQFAAALRAGAVDYAQPSVTKVGGVTEFLRVAELAREYGTPLQPHCPYFGPGFFASLHLAAALPEVRELEYHFVEPEAWLAHPGTPGADGTFEVPQVPGTGFAPDARVLERYTRGPR